MYYLLLPEKSLQSVNTITGFIQQGLKFCHRRKSKGILQLKVVGHFQDLMLKSTHIYIHIYIYNNHTYICKYIYIYIYLYMVYIQVYIYKYVIYIYICYKWYSLMKWHHFIVQLNFWVQETLFLPYQFVGSLRILSWLHHSIFSITVSASIFPGCSMTIIMGQTLLLDVHQNGTFILEV